MIAAEWFVVVFAALVAVWVWVWWRRANKRLDDHINQAVRLTIPRPRGPEDGPDWPTR